jgi:hypothetical protein
MTSKEFLFCPNFEHEFTVHVEVVLNSEDKQID